jgi:uncharacterized membrane protein
MYFVSQGFVRDSHGTICVFNFPGTNTQTYPGGINPRGEIVGTWINYDGPYLSQAHGFLRQPDGTLTSIDVGGPDFPDTSIDAINAEGRSVGFYDNFNVAGKEGHAFLREADGSITVFDVLNASFTVPQAINDKGQIAGEYVISNLDPIVQRAFLRDRDGTITTFDVPSAVPGGTNVVALDSKGDITGFYEDPAKLNWRGFVRKADGTITTFDAPNAEETMPTAMNPRGEIVGLFTDTSNHLHGFVMNP